MTKYFYLLFCFITFEALLFSVHAQKYGCNYNDIDPYFLKNETVVDTISVFEQMKHYENICNVMLGLLGSKTDNTQILDFANSILTAPYVLDQYDIKSIQKDLDKGKISRRFEKELQYRNSLYSRCILELEENLRLMKDFDDPSYFPWQPYCELLRIYNPNDIPSKDVKLPCKNLYYRPNADPKTRDLIDVNQQNVGYEWIFTETSEDREDSYPIKMNYNLYPSHPELRFCSNAIYDNEGHLKRIILLQRFASSHDIQLDNLKVGDNNGVYSISSRSSYNPLSIHDRIMKVIYANDYYHNKYNIQVDLNDDIKYAIENLVGIHPKSEKIESMAKDYEFAKKVNQMRWLVSSKSAEFNAFYEKAIKYNDIIREHRKKMNNDVANRWYAQVVNDHKRDKISCYKISRVDDLSFRVEYENTETHKVVLKVVVEFFQNHITKEDRSYFQVVNNPFSYDWKIKKVELLDL